MTNKILFPTSVIGSMPRPKFVQELIADDCPHSAEEYERLMGAAIRSVVALQESAGLDVISDGEWWRKSYIGVIAELAHGFELSVNPADGRPWTVVVDRLAPKTPGFIAKEVSFLKKLTNRQIKATLPAPALLGERMWDPVASARRIRTVKPSCETACRFCDVKSNCCVKKVSRLSRSTTRICACSSIPTSAAATKIRIRLPTSPSTWTIRSLPISKMSALRCICAVAPEHEPAAKRSIRAVTHRS